MGQDQTYRANGYTSSNISIRWDKFEKGYNPTKVTRENQKTGKNKKVNQSYDHTRGKLGKFKILKAQERKKQRGNAYVQKERVPSLGGARH